MACSRHGGAHVAKPHAHYARVTQTITISGFALRTSPMGIFARLLLFQPLLVSEANPLWPSCTFCFVKCNEKLKRMKEELRDAHGIRDYAIHQWQNLYHACLKSYMEHNNINKVGCKEIRYAVDETAVGKVSIRVGRPASKLGSTKRRTPRIAKKEPCKTVWKRGARPGVKAKAGSLKDKRKSGGPHLPKAQL